MSDYLSEVYDWITKQDNTFSGDVNIESFQQKMQDDTYAKEMYKWMSSIDKTLPNDLSESDFINKVKKKDTSELQEAAAPEGTQDTPSTSEAGQSSLAQKTQDSLDERLSGYKDLSEEDKIAFDKEEELRPFYEAEGVDYDQFLYSIQLEKERKEKKSKTRVKQTPEGIQAKRYLASVDENAFQANTKYHESKYQSVLNSSTSQEDFMSKIESEGVDLNYIPLNNFLIDGEKVSYKDLERKLYDNDFIDKFQAGDVDVSIVNPENAESLKYLEDLAQRQIESGGRWGDIAESTLAGGLDQLVAGSLELIEGANALALDAFEGVIVKPFSEALGGEEIEYGRNFEEYMKYGSYYGKKVKDYAKEIREETRAYQEGSITKSMLKGDWGNAFFQVGNGVAESAPLIATMWLGTPMLARKVGQKAAERIVTSFAGVGAGGVKSLELKEQRLNGDLNISDLQLLANAALTGFAEGYFEKNTLKIINGMRDVERLGKISPADLADKFVKGFGKSFGLEGSSEAATELSNTFTDAITGAGTPESLTDVLVRMSDAFIIGGIMGGGMHTIAYGAKAWSDFTSLNDDIAVVFTMQDGKKKEMKRGEAIKFIKDKDVSQAIRNGDIKMDASITENGRSKIEEIIYGYYAPDNVLSREVMMQREIEVQNLVKKVEKSKDPTAEDVNAIADALSKMEAEGKKNKYNVTSRTEATRARVGKFFKDNGIEIVDAVNDQDASMSTITETVESNSIETIEEYNAVEKQLEDGKRKPTIVKSQDQNGIKIKGEQTQKSSITQGKFKSVSSARNAMKDFKAKLEANKNVKPTTEQIAKDNNKAFLNTKKDGLDKVPKKVIDSGKYHIISPDRSGLTKAELESRMENTKADLEASGATVYTITEVVDGKAKQSLLVANTTNAAALGTARNLQVQSVFSGKDGVLNTDGSVVPLDNSSLSGPEARQAGDISIININGRKTSIHRGVDKSKTTFGKSFDSNNVHKLDESDPNYDKDILDGVPSDRKRALGFAFKLLSSIGGLKVTVVRNSDNMYKQLKALGYSNEKATKGANSNAFFRGQDKSIYINLENVKGNTLFHEIVHPLVDFMKKNSPETYAKIEKEVSEGKVKRRYIKDGRREKGTYLEWAQNHTYYSTLSKEAQIEEAFAEMIGDAAYGHFVDRNSRLGRLRALISEILSKIGVTVTDQPEKVSLDDLNLAGITKNLTGALVNGRTITVGKVEFEVGESKIDMRNQAVDLLEDKEDLSEYGVEPESRSTLRELGIALDARQRDKYKVIDKDTKTEDASDYISDFIKDEVIYSIENVEDSGAGWYEEKYERALNNLAEVNDFMKEGEPSRELFTMFLAITSDGQTVSQNLDYAERLTKEYVENKTINVDAIDFGGTGKASIKINTRNILDLLDQFNGDIVQVKDFLNIQNSISEFKKDYPDVVKKSNYEMTGEAADKIKLPMAAMIFGPKLGAFYGNLTGGSGYLTMDRWFNRTFNRYRGIVKKPLGKERYDKAREAIIKLKSLESKYNLDYGIKLPSSKNLSKDRVVEIAKKVASLYVKDNKRRKSLPKELKSLESPLNTFSKGYSDLQDEPFGKKDRTFMYDSIWKAQEKLSKKGYDVTVADIQAILWYFEKSLYKKFGVAGPPIESYEEVSERVISDLRMQAPTYDMEYTPNALISLSALSDNNRQPEQWVKEIAKGVKGASRDVDTMGLLELLKTYKKDAKVKSISKEVVESLIATNMAPIETTILGWENEYGRSDAMYNEVTLPQGENYREFLIHDVSGNDLYKAPHYNKFGSELGQNLIASARVDDRVGPNGEKILFVQEIQSDWVQGTNKDDFTSKDEINKIQEDQDLVREDINKLEVEKRRLSKLKDEKFEEIQSEFQNFLYFKKIRDGEVGNADVDLSSQDDLDFLNELIKEKEEAYEASSKTMKRVTEELKDLKDRLVDLRARDIVFDDELSKIKPYLPWNQTDLWVGLTIRKLINQASKEGYDQIAFVNGEQSDIIQGHSDGRTAEFYNKIVPKNINNELKRLVKGMKYEVSEFIGDLAKGDVAKSYEEFLELPLKERDELLDIDNKNAVINLTPELKAATDKVGPLRFQAPTLFNEPNPESADIARMYMNNNAGILGIIPDAEVLAVSQLDEANSKMIADAYENLVDDPTNPEVKAAYEALADEIGLQYESILERGYNVEIWEGEGEPYANSAEMIEDVRDNKHMYIFGTEGGFGEAGITQAQRGANAMLADTPYTDVNGKQLVVNDLFRFVHDFFGHTEIGNGFGPVGEENAWLAHARMFSKPARLAMTTETRGQNSWVNFNESLRREDGSVPKRGDDDYIPLSERPFADQKMGLMAEEISYPKDLKYQVPTGGQTNVYKSGLAAIAWDIGMNVINADYNAGKYITGIKDKDRAYDIRLSTLLGKPFGTHSNEEIKEIMVRSKSELNRQLFRVDQNSKALKRALKNTDYTAQEIDDLLHNYDKIKAMDDGDVKKALVEMRKHIDLLSRTLIDEGLVQGQTQFTIDSNMGVYVSRSYKQFQNKGWKQTDNDIIKRVEDFLYKEAKKDNPNDTEEQLTEKVDLAYRKLKDNKDFDYWTSRDANLAGLSRVNSIFKEKKLIPEEIREFWGEIDNPLYNYSSTVRKMAQDVSAERMYKELMEVGDGKFLSNEQTAEFYNEITGNKWGSLNGKFVDEQMFSVINQIDKKINSEGFGKIQAAYMKLVLFNKKMKTIYNIGTHAKNVVGNTAFAMMNGHINFDAVSVYENGKTAIRAVKTMKDDDVKALYDKLVGLGVVNSSASLQEIRGIAEDLSRNDFDFNDFTSKGTTFSKKVKQAPKKFDNWITELYQKEDDVWKIFGFLAEKGRYIDAGLDVKTAEELAAKNIRNTYPNYDRIPRVIRALGRSPLVGSFVAFQAEAVRNVKNTIQLGFQEVSSDNPKIRAIGAQRIAGTVVTSTLMGSLQIQTAQFLAQSLGFLSEDEETSESKLIRILMPIWDATGNLVVWNRGNLDTKQFKGQSTPDRYFDYINFSSTSGIGYIKDVFRLAFTDIDTVAGKESVLRVAEKIYEPFLGKEMTAGLVQEALTNRNSKIFKETDSNLEKVWSVISYIGNKVQPGITKSGARITKAALDMEKDLVAGYEVLALLGIRISRINVNKNLSYKGYFINKEMVESVGREAMKDESTVRSKAREDKDFDNRLNQLADVISSASYQGLSGEDIRNILRYKGDESNRSGLSEAVIMEAYNRHLLRYDPDVINVE